MKLDKLTIRNFLTVGEMVVDLGNAGLTAVVGKNLDTSGTTSNGSGKSAIWDALTWCLFGETLRKNYGGDLVVNRFRKGGTKVSVQLISDDGRCEVVRYRKDKEHKNSLFLFVEPYSGEGANHEQDISKATATETQKVVEQLIGMDFKTFSSVVVFGSETLRFAGATDKEQKEILDKLLGMEHYDVALRLVRADLAIVAKDFAKAEIESTSIKARMEEIGNEAARLSKAAAAEQEQRTLGLAAAQKDYDQYTASLPDCLTRRDLLQDQYRILDSEMARVADPVQNLKDAQTKRIFAAKRMEATQGRAEQLLAESDTKEKLRDALKTSPKCGTCQQPIGTAERLRQQMNVETELTDLAAKGGELEADMESAQKAMQEAEQTEAEATTVYRTDREKRAKLAAAKSSAEAALAEWNKVTAQIAAAAARLEELKKPSAVDYGKLMAECKTRLESEMKMLQQYVDKKNELALVREALQYWEKAFGPSGIRSFLLDHITPFLTERANHYATILTDGALRIEFSAQKQLKGGDLRDKFEVKAINADGAEVYAGNSGGEKQRIDICVAMALLDLARSRATKPINLAVFDETFERVDVAGCERVVAMLRTEASKVGNVFVTTHNDALLQHFPKILKVQKTKDHISSLVEGR